MPTDGNIYLLVDLDACRTGGKDTATATLIERRTRR